MLEPRPYPRTAHDPGSLAFTAPIVLVGMLTGARQPLMAGTPSRALTFVDAARSRLTRAAEQRARTLDAWAAHRDGDEEPIRPGD